MTNVKKLLLASLTLPLGLWFSLLRAPYLFYSGFDSFPSLLDVTGSRVAFWIQFVLTALIGGAVVAILIDKESHKTAAKVLLSLNLCGLVAILINRYPIGVLSWVLIPLCLSSVVPCIVLFANAKSPKQDIGWLIATLLGFIVAAVSCSICMTGRLPVFLGGFQKEMISLNSAPEDCRLPQPLPAYIEVFLQDGETAWVQYRTSSLTVLSRELPKKCLNDQRFSDGRYEYFNKPWRILK